MSSYRSQSRHAQKMIHLSAAMIVECTTEAETDGAQVNYNDQGFSGVGQALPGALNMTAHAQFIINNASCIFYSMWLPNALPEDLAKYSVALYMYQQIAAAVSDTTLSQPYNYSFCTGLTCNVAAGIWNSVFDLNPSNPYWFVSSYSWDINPTNNQRNWGFAQAFSEGITNAPCACCAWPPIALYILWVHCQCGFECMLAQNRAW